MLEALSEIGLKSNKELAQLAERLKEDRFRYPVDNMIEVATLWATELLGQEEVIAAQECFYAQTGKVFYDDSFYDTRISYFIEHFLFERPISGLGRTYAVTGMIPYQLFISKALNDTTIDERTKVIISSLAQARHSLFQVQKVRPSTMIIKDLLIPQKIQISAKSDESYRAFNTGTVFQGFIFRLPEACHLGSGLIIHPNRAKAIIRRYITAAKINGATPEYPLLCKLATLQLKQLRHQHVDAKIIYQSLFV